MARRNSRLKKAGTTSEYTPELIAEFRRCASDPIYFAQNYVKIKHPKLGKIPFKLYPYQEEMMRMYMENRYNILLSARQTGKTETTCAYLLWFAIFHDDKTILVASNKSANAKEIIAKIQYAYEELPDWLKPGVDDTSWNKHECSFDNKSRIVATATSQNSGRGMSISLLYCDEFAFVMPHIQTEFWDSILPTLSTGGSCIISSTPNGDSNLFATLYRGAEMGTNDFKYRHVRWDEPPGRDEVFKEQQIGLLGERKWRQEYECDFLSSDANLIEGVVLAAAEKQIKLLKPAFVIEDGENKHDFWAKINPLSTYIVGVDPATGSGLDYGVITVFEFPSMLQIMEYRTNTMIDKEMYKLLKNILNFLANTGATVYFSIENNGVGAGMIALHSADERPPEVSFVSEQGKNRVGFATSQKSKIRSCMKLKELVENSTIILRSLTLVTELKNFVRRLGSYSAQAGATDDCISALLIVLRVIEEIAQYDERAYHLMYTFEQPDTWEDADYDEPDVGYRIPVSGFPT